MSKYETYTARIKFSINFGLKDSIKLNPGDEFLFDGETVKFGGKKGPAPMMDRIVNKRGWAVKGSLKGKPSKKAPAKKAFLRETQESDPLKNVDSSVTGRSEEEKVLRDLESFKLDTRVVGDEKPRRPVVNGDDAEVAKVSKTAGEEKVNSSGIELGEEEKKETQVVYSDQNVAKETSYNKDKGSEEKRRKPLVVDADSEGVEVRKVTRLDSSPEVEKREAEEREKLAYVEEKSVETSYEDTSESEVTSSTTPVKRTSSKKSPAKKSAAKKTPSKKSSAKKSAVKKTPSKKSASKKTSGKKSDAKPSVQVEDGGVYKKARSLKDNSSKEASRLGFDLPPIRVGSSDESIISGGAQVSSSDLEVDI